MRSGESTFHTSAKLRHTNAESGKQKALEHVLDFPKIHVFVSNLMLNHYMNLNIHKNS